MSRAANQRSRQLSRRRLGLCLFFGLWLLYGILIEDHDLTSFNLQQMGVEAIVERGVFYVDGSRTPELQPGGDVFEHAGHLYAAKQPGEFLAGALAYAPLHRLGLSYARAYVLSAALVTFFTASFLTAAAAVCVFRLALDWAPAGALFWPLLASLSFALATSAAPYSGVAHHDALASAYLIFAFALLTRLGQSHSAPAAMQARPRSPGLAAALAGFLLGLTLTTSMLPFFMVVAIALYFLSLRRWRLLPHLIGGGIVGLAPLLFYNAVSFGNPFLVANVAGAFSDTFFWFDWRNLVSKLAYYGKGVTLYEPIVWVGLCGYLFFPRRLARERLAVGALLLGLAAYVCNIETLGGCQYGPRYLLPAMPFAALGLAGFGDLRSARWRMRSAVLALCTAVFSATVNVLGAMYGAMYCDLQRYAFAHYVDAVRHDVFRSFPLALWLVGPLGLWMVWATAIASDRRRELEA
jgi:hypothetical protein